MGALELMIVPVTPEVSAAMLPLRFVKNGGCEVIQVLQVTQTLKSGSGAAAESPATPSQGPLPTGMPVDSRTYVRAEYGLGSSVDGAGTRDECQGQGSKTRHREVGGHLPPSLGSAGSVQRLCLPLHPASILASCLSSPAPGRPPQPLATLPPLRCLRRWMS